MAYTGLFTRVDAKDAAKKSTTQRKRGLPLEAVRAAGPRAVSGMNPEAQHPEMLPTGAKRPLVYILGEAPGRQEDEEGRQFVGASGQELRAHIPSRYREAIRWDNCCRTRPPQNRTPSPVEVEAFRNLVEADIASTKPKVLIGAGFVPLAWALPGVSSIFSARGRRFPIRIKDHALWFYPILHPAYMLRVRDQKKVHVQALGGEVPGDELVKTFAQDVRRPFNDLDSLPNPEVEDSSPEGLMKGVRILLDPNKALEAIRGFLGTKNLATDLETTHTRPYSKGARVISCALAREGETIAFPLDHPRSGWTRAQVQEALALLKKVYASAKRVTAHNLMFELEWFAHLFGLEFIAKARGMWHCTMQAAYVLCEQQGILGLNFLCQEYFGLPIKHLTKVDRRQLLAATLQDLCQYNAYDAKYTLQLKHKLIARVEEEGLVEVYHEQMDRIPTMVRAQVRGKKIDQVARLAFSQQLGSELAELRTSIEKRPEVQQVRKTKGRFNVDSNDDLALVFRDVLKRPEGTRNSKKGYSTDASVLSSMVGVPLAKLVLQYRELAKLKGTYIDSLDPANSKRVVYPDGRIHTQYKLSFTRTGRSSSEDPNEQNFPKRKHREIRRVVAADKGNIFLASDQGQIEARVLGMASGDKAFCRALRDDLDVHMEWAEKLVRAHKRVLEKGEDMKSFRGRVKNQWVFPAFYGSSSYSIAQSLGMPQRIADGLFDEFWHEFAGVKRWHRRVVEFYHEHGYVECLTGRRRHGPLGFNQIINSPIQGTASDIVFNCANRLCAIAEETGQWWLAPVMNVHDDLTFEIPEAKLDEAAEVIIREMLDVPYDFINVPLTVEAEVGYNWFELGSIGTFRSDLHLV